MLGFPYATSIGMWCIRIGTAYLMGIVLWLGLASVFEQGSSWIMVSLVISYVTVTSVI